MSKLRQWWNRQKLGGTGNGYRVIIQTEVLVNAQNRTHAKNQVLDVRESIAFAVRKHQVPTRELGIKVKS